MTDSLRDNNHYFYRVKTLDDGGLSSDWSFVQDFWTNAINTPPEPFLLYSPENGVRQVLFYTSFIWGTTIDSDPNSSFTYTLEYSSDSLFEGSKRDLSGIVDTSLAVITDSLATILTKIILEN